MLIINKQKQKQQQHTTTTTTTTTNILPAPSCWHDIAARLRNHRLQCPWCCIALWMSSMAWKETRMGIMRTATCVYRQVSSLKCLILNPCRGTGAIDGAPSSVVASTDKAPTDGARDGAPTNDEESFRTISKAEHTLRHVLAFRIQLGVTMASRNMFLMAARKV